MNNYNIDLIGFTQTNIASGFTRKVERRKEKTNLEEIYASLLGNLDLDIKPVNTDDKFEGFELLSSDATKLDECFERIQDAIKMNLKNIKIEARNIEELDQDILDNSCQFFGIKFIGIEGNYIKVQGLEEDVSLYSEYLKQR